MRKIVYLLGLFFVAVLLACVDSFDAEQSDSGVSFSQARTGGRVEGFVVGVTTVARARATSVAIVGTLEGLTGGATPLGGILVSATDANGDFQGFGLTGPDGRFVINGTQPGLIRLQAREDANSPLPDAEGFVTAFAGATVTLGAEFPVSRQQAIALAVANVPASSRVAGSLNPMPGGAVVTAANTPTEGVMVGSPTWLFFIDKEPTARFAHPVEYRLVDALSGQVRIIEAEFNPTVDGREIWASPKYLYDYRSIDSEDLASIPPGFVPTALPEVVQGPAPDPLAEGDPPALSRVFNEDPDSVFALLIAGADFKESELNVARFKAFLRNQGVPQGQISSVLAKGRLYAPVLDEVLPEIEVLRNLIKSRANENPPRHSTLIVFMDGHGGKDKFFLGSNGEITAPEIVGGPGIHPRASLHLLDDMPACRVRLIFDSCESGGLIQT